jgi:predicted DNA-binding antitoxin AbrB/MazE fold protein
MSITIQAVYEGGVLRPVQPLDLPEGTTVEVTIVQQSPPLTLEEWERQIQAAQSFQEWAVLANACPDPGPDFDIVQAINESRRLTGFRMPDPPPDTEVAE